MKSLRSIVTRIACAVSAARIGICLLALVAASRGLLAQPAADSVRAISLRTVSDSVRPSPAFGWPEVRGFALTAALGGVASLADQSVRDRSQSPGPQSSDVVHAFAEHGDLFGQPVSLALAWAMYGGGLYAKRPVLAKTGFRAVESITVSGGVTWFLKQVLGRARPHLSPDNPQDFEWGRGFGKLDGDFLSMPSGHTTAAFAFATAVTKNVSREAPQHARWVAITTYGSASLTAFARIYKDRHWLSDVTVGAGIGTVTALAIDRWHTTRPNNRIDGFFLKPVLAPLRDGSTGIGFNIEFR